MDRAAKESDLGWRHFIFAFRPEFHYLLAKKEFPGQHSKCWAFSRRGLIVRLAIADTVGAAWALAHYGNGTCVAPIGDKAIRPLPIDALRLYGQAEILADCGIERIEQLMALPRKALAERFDPQLLLRLNQAIGTIPEPIASHRPPPEIEIAKRLEFPLSDRQALEQLLAKLLASVAQELARRQQGALQIRCELRCESTTIAFTVGTV